MRALLLVLLLSLSSCSVWNAGLKWTCDRIDTVAVWMDKGLSYVPLVGPVLGPIAKFGLEVACESLSVVGKAPERMVDSVHDIGTDIGSLFGEKEADEEIPEDASGR